MHRSYSLTRRNLRDVVIVVSLACAFFVPLRTGQMYLAFALLAMGCFIHIVSKGILIRNRVLCNKGAYRLVRHPYYLANYLIDSSFCLLSGSLFLVVFYPFLFFWAYGPTIRGEERTLFDVHSDAFVQDSFTIPQVFPDRLSIGNIRGLFNGFSLARVTWKEYGRLMKFCATALLLATIHEVKADGIIEGIKDIVSPTRLDYDEFVFAVAAASFYAAGVVLLRLARKKVQSGAPSDVNA